MPVLDEAIVKETQETPLIDLSGILGYLNDLPEQILVIHYPKTGSYAYAVIEGTRNSALIASEDVAILEAFLPIVKVDRSKGKSEIVWRTIGEAREIVRAAHTDDKRVIAVAIFDGPAWKQVRIEYVF